MKLKDIFFKRKSKQVKEKDSNHRIHCSFVSSVTTGLEYITFIISLLKEKQGMIIDVKEEVFNWKEPFELNKNPDVKNLDYCLAALTKDKYTLKIPKSKSYLIASKITEEDFNKIYIILYKIFLFNNNNTKESAFSVFKYLFVDICKCKIKDLKDSLEVKRPYMIVNLNLIPLIYTKILKNNLYSKEERKQVYKNLYTNLAENNVEKLASYLNVSVEDLCEINKELNSV